MSESDSESEIKEWLTVSHSPGRTTVRCSLTDGNLSVKWTVKTYGAKGGIKDGVIQARVGADKALIELREAVAE